MIRILVTVILQPHLLNKPEQPLKLLVNKVGSSKKEFSET
jgi:hypothetical protein